MAHIDTRAKIHHFEAPNEKRKKFYVRKNSERPLNTPLQIWGFWSMHGQIWQKVKILQGADYWVLTRSNESQTDGFWVLSGIKDDPVLKHLAVKEYQ